jgi:uncharacterized protein YecA (UPF0149 family)
MQAMFDMMRQHQYQTNEDQISLDSRDESSNTSSSPQAAPASNATIGDVFASMMSEAGRRANAAEALQRNAARNIMQSSSGPAVGRNDPCPCGSGKKYKKCCGRNQL